MGKEDEAGISTIGRGGFEWSQLRFEYVIEV